MNRTDRQGLGIISQVEERMASVVHQEVRDLLKICKKTENSTTTDDRRSISDDGPSGIYDMQDVLGLRWSDTRDMHDYLIESATGIE